MYISQGITYRLGWCSAEVNLHGVTGGGVWLCSEDGSLLCVLPLGWAAAVLGARGPWRSFGVGCVFIQKSGSEQEIGYSAARRVACSEDEVLWWPSQVAVWGVGWRREWQTV